MKSYFLIYGFIAVIFFACDKENASVERPFPYVFTNEVTNINSDGALFSADITNFTNEHIIDHGFTYQLGGRLTRRYSLGPKNDNNPHFSVQINADLKKEKYYNVKGYLETESYMVYGKNTYFLSSGSKGFEIHSISPSAAYAGDTINISGKYFIPSFIYFNIAFDNTLGKTLETSANNIKVIVPNGIHKKEPEIKISIGSEEFLFDVKFTLLE